MIGIYKQANYRCPKLSRHFRYEKMAIKSKLARSFMFGAAGAAGAARGVRRHRLYTDRVTSHAFFDNCYLVDYFCILSDKCHYMLLEYLVTIQLWKPVGYKMFVDVYLQ